MTYVLDTNVVSALRLPARNPAVQAWADSVPVSEQFLAAPTLAEIERGVFSKERSDPAQGENLRRWFERQVLATFAYRTLPLDLRAARILAAYRVPEHAPYDDALIAAVAQAAGKIVVTRNTRHFEPLGVPCLDPWSDR
ncbi:VapC toxin family PIN domain ribonuclease [Mycolicibacterium peregrinum]|uniref:type II toxin-antitoxin system VapC family toxin n=1 Tax=Mycolicibacterium peregrinum TaxID=43304 RepID=UPI000B4BDF80|nr:type II toxin-antitoxin system VapC family toxin [Mycolicibacterium peregrinum]OWL98131.1 VapC toxin family PIN domain ribonuclease [Mycolicibacterium peregrinum]